jgi:hypothetical protein
MASAAAATALPVLYGYWRRYALGLGTLIEKAAKWWHFIEKPSVDILGRFSTGNGPISLPEGKTLVILQRDKTLVTSSRSRGNSLIISDSHLIQRENH